MPSAAVDGVSANPIAPNNLPNTLFAKDPAFDPVDFGILGILPALKLLFAACNAFGLSNK